MFLIQIVDLYYSIKNYVYSTSSFKFIEFMISYCYYKKSFEPIGDYSSVSYLTLGLHEPTTKTYKNLQLTCRIGGYHISKQIPVITNEVEIPVCFTSILSFLVIWLFDKPVLMESFQDKKEIVIQMDVIAIDYSYFLEEYVPVEIFVSNTSFISIEYTHPKLDKPLSIKIPRSYFVVGNEILTDIFVCRYLSYEYGKHVIFEDMNYALNIIDSNINILSIGKDKYIELTENGYSVKDNVKIDIMV